MLIVIVPTSGIVSESPFELVLDIENPLCEVFEVRMQAIKDCD